MNMNTIKQELNKKLKLMSHEDFLNFINELTSVWNKHHHAYNKNLTRNTGVLSLKKYEYCMKCPECGNYMAFNYKDVDIRNGLAGTGSPLFETYIHCPECDEDVYMPVYQLSPNRNEIYEAYAPK